MSVGPKRILLADKNSPLVKRAVPALLNTFSLGVRHTETKWLLQGAALLLVMTPVMFVVSLLTRPLVLALPIAGWWLLRSAEVQPVYAWLIAGVAFAVLFRSEIRSVSAEYVVYLLVLVSGGRFLRWLCEGNLAGAPFRQMVLASEECVTLVTTMLECVPANFRAQYREVLDVVTDSTTTETEAESRLEVVLRRDDPPSPC